MRLRALVVLAIAFAACIPALATDHSDDPYRGTILAADGRPVAGRIDHDSDRDWFRIQVASGEGYSFRTQSLTSGMDSILALFGTDGRRVGYDDDGGGGYASKIDWTATASGTAYLVVLHYSATGRGGYELVASRTGGSNPPPGPAPPPAGAFVRAPGVFDPKLPGASFDVTYGIGGGSAQSTALRILDAGGRTVRTVATGTLQPGQTASARWDGRSDAGTTAPIGAYRAVLVAGSQSAAQAAFAIVRLGISEVRWSGSGRVALLYHRSDPSRLRSYLPVDSLGPTWSLPRSDGSLDDASGRPIAGPSTPWSDTRTPPRTSSGSFATRGTSLPVAFASGGARTIQVVLGSWAVDAGGARVGCGYPVSGTPIRAVVDGVPSGEVQPGGTASIALAPLSGGVGRRDAAVSVSFQYLAEGAWREIPGRLSIVQRTYVLLRVPDLAPTSTEAGRAPYLPWVHAVDRVAAWSNGQAATDGAVMDAVTRRVYAGEGLRYDRASGAPAYSGGYPYRSTFDLSVYDGLGQGIEVNCTDCANLVSIHARMVGVDAKNVYLGYNFPLNYLKGIGWDWTNQLFFGGGHAFSFHNVSTATAGSTIHDACLAVDGDGRPESAPHSEVLPLGLTFRQYHDALTPGTFQGRALDRSRFE